MAAAPTPKELFTGAWMLISEIDRDSAGHETFPRGQNPSGLLIYQANGWMSVQLTRRERRSGMSLNALSTALTEYLAYFGTFIIDPQRSEVTHFVLGSTYPAFTNRQLIRQYHFEDDGATLVLVARAPQDRDVPERTLIWRQA